MDYLVAPSEPTEWRFPRADFVRALLQKWPHAKVDPQIPGHSGAYFRIPEGDGHFIFGGDLLDNEQTFAFEDDLEHVAEFTIWLRSVIPSAVPLLFFSESGMCNVRLTGATTKEELVQAIMDDRRDLGP